MSRLVLSLKTLVLFLYGLAACTPSLVQEEMVVPTPPAGPTITAFLCPQDSIHRVRVSYTAPAVGTSGEALFLAALPRTLVRLTQDGRSVTLGYDTLRRVFTTMAGQFPLRAGGQISLLVQLPDRPPVNADCTIPASSVDSSSIRWAKSGTMYSDGESLYRFRWRDIPGEPNFYAFWRLTAYYDGDTGRRSVRDEQVQFQLNDQALSGGEVVTDPISLPRRIELGRGSYEQTQVLICLTDEFYYTYHRLLSQLRRDESPFTEPVRLPTNVRGGYGIVAGYNRVRITLP